MFNSKKIPTALFVAGTDTGVGKTMVTALLAMGFEEMGLKVEVQKWVTTGNDSVSEDVEFICGLLGRQTPEPGSLQTPYCLAYPASPHLSAQKEGRIIDFEVLADATQSLLKDCDVLLIEGAGGLMVPYTFEVLQVDLIVKFALPVCLVARAGLGTINHTLLSIAMIRKMGINVKAIMLNGGAFDDPIIVEDNKIIIEERSSCPVVGPFPYFGDCAGNVVRRAMNNLLNKKTLLTIL